jgi:mRNA interferase MazF
MVPPTWRDGKHNDASLHVAVAPPEGDLRQSSSIKCEDIRSVKTDRLVERWGRVTPQTLRLVADRLRLLLDL